MKISDFAVNADWDTDDTLQILNASGGTAVFEYDDEEFDALFSYFTSADLKSCPAPGWYHQESAYDGTWISIADANFDTLPYGFAVVYETASDDAGLVFSGQVADEAQTIVCANTGWNLIGNPMPVSADFDDITPNEIWDTDDTLQILNASGGTATFTYDDEDFDALFSYFTKDNLKSCPSAGWYHQESAYDGTWISIQDAGWTGLKPGQAVVFETADKSAGIQFPAAINK